MQSEKWNGYDPDDCYGDVVSLESIERDETRGDVIAEERAQRTSDEFDAENCNAAIERLIALGVW